MGLLAHGEERLGEILLVLVGYGHHDRDERAALMAENAMAGVTSQSTDALRHPSFGATQDVDDSLTHAHSLSVRGATRMTHPRI
ncbi:hypothetical protein UG56_002145 [Nocardioides luteus]|uniref:Uncharacterized protein n=1 Tax=Nocardioides luteus TaxID=1844 RepID=A0A1J4NDB9_9ACTN|nr:hypothetical protein UG56_002145 [Nocardioides luteus]